jgi:hypothetical protein
MDINPLTFMGNSEITNFNKTMTKKADISNEFVAMLLKNIFLKDFKLGMPSFSNEDQEQVLVKNTVQNDIINDVFKQKMIEDLGSSDIFNLKEYLNG